MNKIVKLMTALMMVLMAVTFSACKKSFDNPPGAVDPAIVANTTIADLKLLHTGAGAYDVITSDLVISGIVVADDKSGNLYKQLFIQDATGGLQILLDANSLYGTYPVGRKIFIKCKDLCISDYNNTMQLGVKAIVGGVPSLEGIPGNLISKYVIGGSLNNPVVPKVVTIADLAMPCNTCKPWLQPLLGTLIQLDGFAFVDRNTTYSDTSAYKSTLNRDIKNCLSQTITVRNSAYANFAGIPLPLGRGSIAAIFTAFGTTQQLLLRDTTDVKFNSSFLCPGVIFLEDFETVGANGTTLVLPGWKNIQEVGTNPASFYQNAIFGSPATRCAKVSAFNSGGAATTWLISPGINLTGATAPKLSFTNAAGFISALPPQFRVYISTTYPGSGVPSTYFTTLLPASIAVPPASGGFSSFISSGTINLSAYIGQTVYIGFRYDGNDPTGTASDATATYEIDDVKVTAQ